MGGLLLKGLSFLGFAVPILTDIFIWFDGIIYKFADLVLQAFFDIAMISADVSRYNTTFNDILRRVMVLAGVFALFKFAFMLINYLMDPSKVSDASKNGAGFVKGIIMAVILLVASPIIFEQLGRLQGLVIEQEVIPKLIYGVDLGEDGEENWTGGNIETQSKAFVNRVWLLFFTPKSGTNCSGNTPWYCEIYNDLKIGEAGISEIASAYNHFDYLPFISGIMGMVLIYYFAIYAIELGTRIVKLFVLQIISPIPIIMSVDPSQKKKLSEFAKLYMTIFLQVFIRIFTVYLAFVVCQVVVDTNFGTNVVNSGMLMASSFVVKILLYIGIFQSAKELPKLVEDALGLKMSGAGGKDSFGKVLKTIVGGTAIGAVGAVGGAVAGGISGGLTGGTSGAVSGALGGAASGLFHGALDGAKAKDISGAVKAATGSVKGSINTGANIARMGGIGSYALGGIENAFGGNKRDKATLEQYDKDIEKKDKSIEGVNKKIGDINKEIGVQNGLMGNMNRASELKDNFENAFVNSGRGDFSSWLERNEQYTTARDLLANESSALLPENREYLQKQLDDAYNTTRDSYNAARDSYFEDNFTALNNGGKVDETFLEAFNEYNDYVIDKGMENRVIKSYKGENSILDATNGINEDKANIQAIIDEQQALIDKEEEKIKEIEQEKEVIKGNKKKFSESDQVKRRDVDKRKEGYKSRARNTQDGNNSN